MVVVTHEMGFARNVSNHVIFLHQGKNCRKKAILMMYWEIQRVNAYNSSCLVH